MAPKLTLTKRIDATDDRLEAIEVALSIRPPALPRPGALARSWSVVTRHKTTTTLCATILIGTLSIGGALLPHWLDQRDNAFNDTVDHRIEKTLKESGGVLETLGQIKDTTTKTSATLAALQPYIQDLVHHQLDNASRLSPQALEGRLPAVNDLLKVARDQRIYVPTQTSESLSKNLIKVSPSANGYWPAVGQMVSYRSSFVPNLSDRVPCGRDGNMPFFRISGGPLVADMVGEGTFSDCILDLDQPDVWTSSKASLHIETENGGLVSNWHLTLRNVTVRYTGTPLTHVSRIVFDHCVFNFEFTRPLTSPFGKLVTKQLLANSTSESVEISAEGKAISE